MAMTHGIEEDHRYHAARARSELDAAFRAAVGSAADAHLQLCGWHLNAAWDALHETGGQASAELDWLDRSLPFHRKCLRNGDAVPDALYRYEQIAAE